MKVSVIVPVYNVEQYLRRCLESVIIAAKVFMSEDRSVEIICVNDGSTDGSSVILQEFSNLSFNEDIVFKIITQDNAGLSAARNAGIRIADGNWITFVDSDDWIKPNYLTRLYSAAHSAGCRIAVIGEQWMEGSKISVESYWCKDRSQATVAWGKLYSSSLFKNVYFPRGKFHEDEFTTYRVLFKEREIATIKSEVYYYAKNPHSIMNSCNSQKVFDELQACEQQLRFFKGHYPRAYGVTVGNKIRICHKLGIVSNSDVEEYRRCTKFSLDAFYWPEHYRNPWLVNRFTWRCMRFIKLLFSGELVWYLNKRR